MRVLRVYSWWVAGVLGYFFSVLRYPFSIPSWLQERPYPWRGDYPLAVAQRATSTHFTAEEVEKEVEKAATAAYT